MYIYIYIFLFCLSITINNKCIYLPTNNSVLSRSLRMMPHFVKVCECFWLKQNDISITYIK